MKTNTCFKLLLTSCATLALLAGQTAQAQGLDMNGYMRAGPGSTKKNASRACYGLAGPGLKYRHGNECDFYAEFGLVKSGKIEGLEYKTTVMPNLWNGATDAGSASTSLAQLYVEGKGFDIAPEATFWAGKRFLGRADVHIVDTYFTILDGVGAGVEMPLAGYKLGLSYLHSDSSLTEGLDRFNVDVSGIAVNPGGTLRVLGTLTRANFNGGSTGLGLTVQHDQDNFLDLGGANTLWLQYAQGSAGLDGNFGPVAGQSGDKSWRIAETLTWQKGPLGGQALALFQHDKHVGGGSLRSTSLGGRVSYALSKHFKLLAELGHSTRKPSGAPTEKLTKFSFGPALAIGPDFWSRPELRLYVTTASWNQAANLGAGPGGVTGLGDGKTRGTSVGAQFEIWF